MPSATASGADASAGGAARNRDHKQGNQERKYTVEQKAAVLRIRKCSPTAFYDILGLEEVKATCTDGEIKKAYRKQSLLTHPDKNGHEHADEAFKMVARAFSVLGDKDKRDKFDRFGTDPDSRFGQAQAAGATGGGGFPGFGRAAGGGAPRGGGGGMWEEEISPEEMFARFFGGGGGGFPFGGGFDTGPQFVFNMGGGPGIRVHQFGGGRPRTRPRQANEQQTEQTFLSTIMSLLPILLLFVFPLLSSIFASESTALPRMVFDTASPPYTMERDVPHIDVKYYVNPNDVEGWTDANLYKLDQNAQITFIRSLRDACQNEILRKRQAKENAYGWFFQDPDKMRMADSIVTPSCDRLSQLGVGLR